MLRIIGVWILKTNGGCQGKGVEIVKDIKEFKKNYVQMKKNFIE